MALFKAIVDSDPMRSSDFEFRNRFFLIGLLFGAGFFCYSFDRVNAATALLEAIARRDLDLSVPGDRHLLQLVLGIATLLVTAAAMIRTWATAYLRP